MVEGAVQRLGALARDIKLAHSVFALPFALLATFLAAGGWPGLAELGLILVCMVLARTFAMLANRYVDRRVDAANPRTADRALPAGRVRPRDAIVAMAVCAAGLVVAASGFGWLGGNWWPLILSPVVLVWLGTYGLAKRWTLLCHFVLGGALALSPLAAGLAIEPASLAGPTLWWLAGFVALWVGGFDVIYALQDVEVDRRDGLRSIPAALGRTGALAVSKGAHLGAVACLLLAGRSAAALGTAFFAATAVVAVVLIVEHRAASRGRFTMAFFTANGLISLMLGGVGIADVVVG